MKKYLINLLPPKEQNFLDRLVYFSFHYLRYILVLTQIVVIGVFFYRLTVDQEIVELDESFKQKKEILEVFEPIRKEGDKIQYKTSQISKIIKNQERLEVLINYILSIFPRDFFLNELQIREKEVVLTGFSLDPYTVKQFYLRLKRDKRFKQINLTRIKKTSQGFDFSFQLSGFEPKEI